MKVTIADRDEGDDGLEPLLLPVRQLLAEELEPDADGDADGDAIADAGPDPAERVAPALLAQERGDDADDQRRFEPSLRAMTSVGSMRGSSSPAIGG